jgi:uncharacterized protein (DUF433 family)
MKKGQSKVRNLGRHIVADPAICHGKPTFRGTRIMVWQALEMVSEGMDFDTIAKTWGDGIITPEAVAEATQLATLAFQKGGTKYAALKLDREKVPA